MLTALVCTWLRRTMEATNMIENEFNAAVIAYLIFDYKKTLTEAEVMQLSKRMIYAADEFGFGLKAALQHIQDNPEYGQDL